MKLFAGLPTTDYQDVLRAIGAVIDERQLRDVRLWEHEDGIVVQGRHHDPEAPTYETLFLTDADLQDLLRKLYARREASGDRRKSIADSP
jgi:hypothetical protein